MQLEDNFRLLTVEEVENLSPMELVAYHNRLIKYKKDLLDEVVRWKDSVRSTKNIMNKRYKAIEYMSFAAVLDREDVGTGTTDHLQGIH